MVALSLKKAAGWWLEQNCCQCRSMLTWCQVEFVREVLLFEVESCKRTLFFKVFIHFLYYFFSQKSTTIKDFHGETGTSHWPLHSIFNSLPHRNYVSNAGFTIEQIINNTIFTYILSDTTWDSSRQFNKSMNATLIVLLTQVEVKDVILFLRLNYYNAPNYIS